MASLFTARYSNLVSKLILFTSCTVHPSGWSGWDAIKVNIAIRVFHPLSQLIGYFPGNVIGFGGREARGVMKDWCKNGLSGQYSLLHSNFDYELALRQTKQEILCVTFTGDELATSKAAQNLYNKFHPTTKIQHLHLDAQELKLNKPYHFGWTKHPERFSNMIHKFAQGNE